MARHWEVQRHRVPPATARQIGLLRPAGRLSVLRGRVIEASDTSAGVRVSIGFGESQAELRAGWLINCTGPASDISSRATSCCAAFWIEGSPGPTRCGWAGYRFARSRAEHRREASRPTSTL